MRKPTASASALFVRLPTAAGEKLDRAAEVLGMHKKDIVAGLVSRYLDVADHGSREALGAASMPRASAGFGEPPRGSYTFKPYDQPEVMTAEQAGAFLQIAPEVVIDLADAGTLPGRKLAGAWRFARTALIGWLSTSPRESR